MALATTREEVSVGWRPWRTLVGLIGDETHRVAYGAFAIRIAGAGLMFVSQTLLARWMGGHEFGNYVYVCAWLTLVSDLVHFGLPLTAQRYVPQYSQPGGFALLRGYLVAGPVLAFGAAAIAAVMCAAAVYLLRDSIEPDLLWPFYFACLALPVYSLTFMLDAIARAYNRIHLALVPAYIARPLLLIAAAMIACAAGFSIGATLICGFLAASAWICALGQVVQVSRSLSEVVPSGEKTFALRQWVSMALPMLLVWGMYTLLTTTDVLVLKQFRPAEEVAHYYAASKTLALVAVVYFAVGAASAHRFAALHVAGDRAGLADFAARMVRFTFWPSLALIAVLLAIGRPVLDLFGPDFSDGYPVMGVLAVGLLARASVGPAERLVNMAGEQRICAAAYAIAFLVNVAGCFVLAPRFGGEGAAAATAMAFVTESLLLAAIARRKLGLSLFVLQKPARMRIFRSSYRSS
jgi:O-antigen/teichoic acid export membrane protein